MGSLAERLRDEEKADCMAMRVMKAADPDGRSTCTLYCRRCREAASHILADAIEAEEAKIAVDAMREAVEGAKPQLPEGIEWPRFEDGELVRIGDEFVTVGGKHIVDRIEFNHERVGLPVSAFTVATYRYGEPVKRPEVLDANGVKVNVGDIVWGQDGKQWNVIGFNHKKEHCVIAESGDKKKDLRPEWLTHRKPDSLEAVMSDLVRAFEESPKRYPDLDPFIKRYHELTRRR